MIAISYRRSDTKQVAGRIHEILQREFGKENVFMDFDSIPYGVDFRKHIQQTLQKANVLVAIIGPDWIGERSKSDKRIEELDDFVRLEIAGALQHNIPIIPVLIDNTPMPEAKTLPADIKGLAFRNGLVLDTGIDFRHHAVRLVAGIRRVLNVPEEKAPATEQKVVPPPSRGLTKILTLSGLGLAIVIGAGLFYFKQCSTQPANPPMQTAAEPTPAIVSTPAATVAEKKKPTPAPSVRTVESASTAEENTYSGQIGNSEAIFRLRFEPGGRVTGSYMQDGHTFRLEGQNPTGKLLLDEYTGDRLTAHIALSRKSSGGDSRWEGTMHNTPPDNRTFSMSLEQGSARNETAGEHTYRGKVGSYDATFQLRFEGGERVSGTYTMDVNNGVVFGLKGRNRSGKLFLEEYTRNKLTAHIELTLKNAKGEIRWEGNMQNTPPDNQTFPVFFSRSGR